MPFNFQGEIKWEAMHECPDQVYRRTGYVRKSKNKLNK